MRFIMPTLIRFVILNVGVGFLLGAATAASIAIVAPGALGHGEGLDPLAFGLQIYAFGASFGLGALATALMMIAED
ncbi:hypothetical protein ASD02_16805 [Ensifer sp. Root1252]|nr:hypothetical protein ASD02_16805 [Ensifer sp. Root1252]KQY76979.1 hypothetical protein ASD52_23580 [Ensifer sp. Root142]KRC57210.1 hypothetical protein ASE32_20120 [Ensifer sp. Root231]KRC87705.1 hypothetical protein ASE47_14275 [Ensifer sp. Root258]